MSSSNDNFLIQFKAIGQGLKKRFFRKPNVADAIDHYESLCRQLQHEGQMEFAALCSLEQAKSYETVSNTSGQTSSLMRGSKYMLDACNDYNKYAVEDDDTLSNNYKMGGRQDGQLQVAVQALQHCIKINTGLGNRGLVLLLNMKIGEILLSNKYFDQALKHFEEALTVAQTNFTLLDQLVIVEKIVKCKVNISELESASQTVAEFLDKVKKDTPANEQSALTSEFVLKFEITRVLLLLLLGCDSTDMVSFIWPEELDSDDSSEPTSPQTLYDSLKEAEAKNSESHIVQTNLKSLVLAVQHGSVEEMRGVHTLVSGFLDETQQTLFRNLIQLQS